MLQCVFNRELLNSYLVIKSMFLSLDYIYKIRCVIFSFCGKSSWSIACSKLTPFFFSERFDLHEEKKIGFDPGKKKKKTGSLKTNWLVKPRYY